MSAVFLKKGGVFYRNKRSVLQAAFYFGFHSENYLKKLFK